MTNDEQTAAPVEAEVRKEHRVSSIWFVPLLALVIGLWMLYEQRRDQGPLISIEFKSAIGLEPGKTYIKTRNVEVGVVESVSLTDDLESVEVVARINKNAERLLREDTQFWIVAPQIGLSGITGLNTILSGVYIELAPGDANVRRHRFTGLEEPPVTPSNTPGMHIVLSTEGMTAYSVGDPIVYMGISVGKIEEVNFNVEERIVYYKTFIRAPYHQLVTDTTRFWNTSGIQIELDTDGISLKTASLQTLLQNSVTFGIPDGQLEGEPAQENAEFAIYKDYASASTSRYRHAVQYVLLIDDSVRGLTVGAPVEYRGIKMGEVLAVNFARREVLNVLNEDYRIPVLISLEPGRAGYPDTPEGKKMIREQTNHWITGGLRAQLKTGNMLTGRLLVDLQHYPDELLEEISYFDKRPVIPTRRGEISQLTSKVEALLDKLYALPLESTMEELANTASAFKDTATSARQMSESLNRILADANDERMVVELTEAIKAMSSLASSFSSGSSSNGEIIATVEELNARLQELQPVLLRLNRQPNSLIFGTQQENDPEPRAMEK